MLDLFAYTQEPAAYTRGSLAYTQALPAYTQGFPANTPDMFAYTPIQGAYTLEFPAYNLPVPACTQKGAAYGRELPATGPICPPATARKPRRRYVLLLEHPLEYPLDEDQSLEAGRELSTR